MSSKMTLYMSCTFWYIPLLFAANNNVKQCEMKMFYGEHGESSNFSI